MSNDYKRFYRSRKERMVAGVAGGLSAYFGIDPTLVRILFVVTALMGGPGLLAYIILLIVVPEEPLGQVNMPTETVEAEIVEDSE